MPGRGGKRPGAGRPKGKVSEATLLLKDKLEPHIDMAIKVLVDAAEGGDTDCAKDILNRYYGKPRQAVEVDQRKSWTPKTLADLYPDEDIEEPGTMVILPPEDSS